MLTLEERFWSKVWRCTHRHPCKRCCWPWGGAQWYRDPAHCLYRASEHGRFTDKRLDRSYAAHRFAYLLTHGQTLILPSMHFHVCHTCHYAHCCNPSHLSLGSASDNRRDRHQLPRVLFPDGTYFVRQGSSMPDVTTPA